MGSRQKLDTKFFIPHVGMTTNLPHDRHGHMPEDILIAFEELYPALNDKRIIFRMDKHFKNGNKGKTKLNTSLILSD